MVNLESKDRQFLRIQKEFWEGDWEKFLNYWLCLYKKCFFEYSRTFWHVKAYFTHPWPSMGYKSICFLFKTTQWNNGKVNPKRKTKNHYKTIGPMRITKTVWKVDFLLARMFYGRKKYTRHLLTIVYSFMCLTESKFSGYFLLNIWDMKFTQILPFKR